MFHADMINTSMRDDKTCLTYSLIPVHGIPRSKLVINELKRQLIEYKLIEKRLEKKYGMSFEEFKRNEVVKRENYSFEVEEDYCDWGLAIDGIATIKKEIQNIDKYI